MSITMSKQVSLKWQIVFMFIPLVSIWAYYRIGNLTNGILLNILLVAGFYGVAFLTMFITTLIFDFDKPDEINMANYDILSGSLMVVLFGFVIFVYWIKIRYMLKWTREFNQKIS
jgi:hypothetical protein